MVEKSSECTMYHKHQKEYFSENNENIHSYTDCFTHANKYLQTQNSPEYYSSTIRLNDPDDIFVSLFNTSFQNIKDHKLGK